jgi:hypothetical protein
VSTRVLLNDSPRQRICHARGLHQGDPLSLLLFILAMEVLSAIFHKGDSCALLQAMGVRQIKHRLSLYVDNLIMFIALVDSDLGLTSGILEVFEGASGLRCNLSKCQIALIRCEEFQVNLATNFFSCVMVEFPVRYLGIPLSTSKLPKSTWQYPIDSVADNLPAWKGSLMHRSGRLTLIKSTLSAMPVHTAICLELPAWVRKALIKIMRGFLWSSTEVVHGVKCAVAWKWVQCPLSTDGLSIPDLDRMGMVLRLRWLWK